MTLKPNTSSACGDQTHVTANAVVLTDSVMSISFTYLVMSISVGQITVPLYTGFLLLFAYRFTWKGRSQKPHRESSIPPQSPPQ